VSSPARIQAFCLAVVAAVGRFAACAGAPAPPQKTDEVIARFSFPKEVGVVLLPVGLKGKTYNFVLDTGATECAYDLSLAGLLGEPIRTEEVGTPVGKGVPVKLYAAPDARLGPFNLRTDGPVFAIDLAPFRETSGEEIYGLIGMEFLKRHVFRIDPDRGEVVFLRSVGPDPGRRVAVALDGKWPFVEVALPDLGASGWFLVDTGAAGSCAGDLHEELFKALLQKKGLKPAGERLTESLAGRDTQRRARLGALSVGGNRHTDLLFGESKMSLLGMPYWSRYAVTFDFGGRALYLKKAGGFDRPDPADCSGLCLVRRRGQTLIDRVAPGSPAAEARLRARDVLLEVDGRSVGGLPLNSLRERLCTGGKRVRLVVVRSGAKREVALVLRSPGPEDWSAAGKKKEVPCP
jgi:hypothetical protein